MGTCYFVGCRECKVFRDLDKFYKAYPLNSRKEAVDLADLLAEEGNVFRHVLLVSFMAEHQGHSCVFFNEHDDNIWLREFNEAKEEHRFWNDKEPTKEEE